MKYTKFRDYLRKKGIRSANAIRDVLLKETFVIIGNINGHNYRQYADENNRIVFDNPEMHVNSDSDSLTVGIRRNGEGRGNTLSFNDIGIIDKLINKVDLLADIESINSIIRLNQEELENKKKLLNYLVETNSDVVNEDDYAIWNKEKVTNSLKKKESNIGIIKV